MGLVLILTGGAVVVLKAYQWLQTSGSGDFLAIVTSLRQQAAVVATLAGMVFLLLDALEKGKVATAILAAGPAAAAASAASAGVPGAPFGRPAGMARVAELIAGGAVDGPVV